MKLYYTPGVCSLAPHILLQEIDLEYEAIKVDLKTKKTEHGDDFTQISQKALVPTLILDNGAELTEIAAMLQYLADLKPELKLAPKSDSFERVRLQEWLNYIATEMHKSHWPLFFVDQAGEQARDVYTAKIKKTYDFMSAHLKDKAFIMDDIFTVADAYLFTVINWHNFVNIDLSPWPVLVAYQERMSARASIQACMRIEGLN